MRRRARCAIALVKKFGRNSTWKRSVFAIFFSFRLMTMVMKLRWKLRIGAQI